MKYEEIKIGDVYIYDETYKETVISKSDKYRVITTIDENKAFTTWRENELYILKPLKEETTLELVSKAVKDIGDFTIEQIGSGVIILTPIKK